MNNETEACKGSKWELIKEKNILKYEMVWLLITMKWEGEHRKLMEVILLHMKRLKLFH